MNGAGELALGVVALVVAFGLLAWCLAKPIPVEEDEGDPGGYCVPLAPVYEFTPLIGMDRVLDAVAAEGYTVTQPAPTVVWHLAEFDPLPPAFTIVPAPPYDWARDDSGLGLTQQDLLDRHARRVEREHLARIRQTRDSGLA